MSVQHEWKIVDVKKCWFFQRLFTDARKIFYTWQISPAVVRGRNVVEEVSWLKQGNTAFFKAPTCFLSVSENFGLHVQENCSCMLDKHKNVKFQNKDMKQFIWSAKIGLEENLEFVCKNSWMKRCVQKLLNEEICRKITCLLFCLWYIFKSQLFRSTISMSFEENIF